MWVYLPAPNGRKCVNWPPLPTESRDGAGILAPTCSSASVNGHPDSDTPSAVEHVRPALDRLFFIAIAIMPLTKPAARLCSCNSLLGLPFIPLISITSSLGSRPLYATSSSPSPLQSTSISTSRPRFLPYHRRQSYATVNNRRPGGSARDDVPDWPKTPHPTPYDIFAMRRTDAYTKHRFFQLVKLYHPDRHSHASAVHHIPTATRLERYRLVVAANDLLSDPSKRSLYDSQGVGWTGSRPATLNESVRHSEKSWRHQPGNAARNATWEDWERWHDARDGKPSDPMYMSNGVFATLVVMLCMVGAFAQMSRAEQAGGDYVEMRKQSNNVIGQQMARTTYMAAGRNKDERVDSFLRERENTTFEYTPSKYDSFQHEAEPRPGGEPGHRRP
ncbi:hypothetical protein G7Z17_g8470 [Cylindrodendrum hubeiense]|uniref:J domain-containing protein n=1 Tax=Cylindrodendrum hubeiense TaxID=595255 RepID=A0A9P5H3K0_9HYPO|nr:hypothetical protein G7Z17_g8470 [Cylindrodendrum hubeiense]